MKKFNKKSGVLVVTFFVIFSAFFGCCLKGGAWAQTVDLTGSLSDNSIFKNSGIDPVHCNACACSHTMDAVFEIKNLRVLNANLSLAEFFQKTHFYIEKIVLLDQNQPLFSKHFPSTLKQSSISIYLQTSVLRI